MTRLVEVDKTGKEILSILRPNTYLAAARKLRNGQIAFVTNLGVYVRLDATGKEVKTFKIGNPQYTIGSVDVLPDGRVVAPPFAGAAKLVEFSPDGKPGREVAVPFPPEGVTRLANGHTLICRTNPPRLAEVDAAGAPVWEHNNPSVRALRARR